MDDFDLSMEDLEEDVEGDERQNRTFIILVAVMGGLLLVGIVAFCAWALLVGGILGGSRTAELPPSETPVEVADLTATAESMVPEPTDPPTAEPTATTEPLPTATATRARPTATPQPTAGAGTSGTVEPTVEPTGQVSSGTAAPTNQPTATPRPSPDELSQTGFGTFAAAILAVGMIFILILARRLRTAH
jgi:hypothetical protein